MSVVVKRTHHRRRGNDASDPPRQVGSGPAVAQYAL